MGTVFIVDSNEVPWQFPTKEWAGKVAEGEPDVRYRVLSSGQGGVPRVQVAEYEPNHYEKPHSHAVSEVLYVLKGELEIGDRKLTPGTMVFIEKDTVYGPLRGGPEGMTFLRVEIPS